MRNYFELSKEQKDAITSSLRADNFCIYFIGGAGLVKIGRTIKPVADRLSSLQTGSPVELELLATATVLVDMPSNKTRLKSMADSVEKAVHDRFSDYRRHGEWFSHPGRILSDVADNGFWLGVLEEAELDSRNVGFRFEEEGR